MQFSSTVTYPFAFLLTFVIIKTFCFYMGLIKSVPNKYNAIFTIVGVITFLGGTIYKFGGDIFDKSVVSVFTEEQLNQAFECNENSPSNKIRDQGFIK